jgi:hypothetical protein
MSFSTLKRFLRQRKESVSIFFAKKRHSKNKYWIFSKKKTFKKAEKEGLGKG